MTYKFNSRSIPSTSTCHQIMIQRTRDQKKEKISNAPVSNSVKRVFIFPVLVQVVLRSKSRTSSSTRTIKLLRMKKERKREASTMLGKYGEEREAGSRKPSCLSNNLQLSKKKKNIAVYKSKYLE